MKLKCEICGTEENVDMYAGGPFSKLCKDCERTVNVVIERYINMLNMMPFGVVAGTFHKQYLKEG